MQNFKNLFIPSSAITSQCGLVSFLLNILIISYPPIPILLQRKKQTPKLHDLFLVLSYMLLQTLCSLKVCNFYPMHLFLYQSYSFFYLPKNRFATLIGFLRPSYVSSMKPICLLNLASSLSIVN